MRDRLVNPFIIGAPASASKFTGRREQVNTIIRQLANPESRGSSAISGERRIGKTSLLHYITSPEVAMRYNLPTDQFVFVSVDTQTLGSYMDSQNLDTFNETVFWHYILRLLSIYQAPSAEYCKELLQQERVGVHDLIPLFAQVAAQDKLVVLLLDEFEWIINNVDPQRPTLLHALRSLINRPVSERGLALITSSEEPLTVLCSHIKFMGSPMPNALVPVHLRPFSTAEAYELIDEYLEGTAVAFSEEDKDFAYDLSEGHPYWLQRACFEMFNRYVEKAEGATVQGTQITMALDALDYEEIKTEIMVEIGRASIPALREREREARPSPRIDLPPTPRRFKIFVSSTWLDLQREREAVEEALHRMCTASFSGMEYFGSRPETPKEVCLEEVSRADAYVGFFAHRYGSMDPDSGLSMTELEYREARECNIPCFIYMMDKSVPILPTYIEQEPEAVAKLKALKQDLLSKHVVSFFTNPDNLAMQVVTDLNNLFKEPTKSERLSFPSHYQLANLIRARHETDAEPYILLLGSSLSLTLEVRRAVCESDDWEAFWTTMQRRSAAECRSLMASPLAGLNLAFGYDCLAELAQAGYFNTILTANIDDTLDNALRILTANECEVLCHGRISSQEITSALSRTAPRVKVVKLRGDINAYKLPLTSGDQFEFPDMLEEAIARLLSQDTILVGDIPYDADIQRCIRRGDGALWVVVPQEPRPGSFLYNAKQARPRGEVITGPGAEFGPFFRTLAEALGRMKPHYVIGVVKPSYVIGEPVTGDAFYGRQEEIEEIVYGQGKAVHVLGMRRIGKTSLLLRVAERVPCVYLDFQKVVGQVSDFARQVQYELSCQRKQHPWLPALSENGDAFACLEQASVKAEEAGTRLFLLCDEAEGLMDFDASFLRRLRGLIWGRFPLRTVFVSAKNLVELDDLCREWHTSPFLSNFPPPLYLGGLTDEAADALITQSQSESPVKAAPELCAEIRRLTNNHPCLIQWLCYQLLQPDNTLRPITPGDLEPDEYYLAPRLEMDFEYLSDTERRILRVIGAAERITEPRLRKHVSHPRLSTFLHGMTQLGYLRREGDDYAVGNAFFARWLQESADWKQKSEISDEATLDMIEGGRRLIKRLAALMRQRKAAGELPYVLVLGAGATLSSGCRAMRDVVQEVVGHYDLKAFYDILDNLSETERYARLQQFFQEPYPSPGYRHLAELAKIGYFDVILSTNFDFLLENAFFVVGLKAEDVEVLVNGRESEDYILKALERRTPRIKLLKLHGDLKARNMAFTPKEIFEFGQKVERVLAKYLNGDVVIIGHEMRDDDINRCIRDGGAIWYVHPEEPAVESFIWRAIQVRPSTVISGEPAQFDNFCEMLYKELTGDLSS